MSEPRNNEVQRFELAKAAWLLLIETGGGKPDDVAADAFAYTDAFLAALDKPKEAK